MQTRRPILPILLFLLTSFLVNAQIYTNEIHYDDNSGDNDESIEVYIENPQPGDLSDYSIVLYNGNNSQFYDTRTLDQFTEGIGASGSYYYYNYTANSSSIQNGAPDGWALVGPGSSVIEFLSYEGTLTASNGPANGMTSTDIGASETGSASEGTSIQNDGTGTWTSGLPETFGAVNGNVLPVELSYFNIRSNNKTLILEWETALEINNDYFEVQHSLDGRHYEIVSEIKSAGDSKTKQYYSYNIKTQSSGLHYVRLKQFDYDGKFTILPTRSITISENKSLKLYPTVADDHLSFSSDDELELDYTLYDLSGKTIQSGKVSNDQEISISNLNSGQYYIKIGALTEFFYKR